MLKELLQSHTFLHTGLTNRKQTEMKGEVDLMTKGFSSKVISRKGGETMRGY